MPDPASSYVVRLARTVPRPVQPGIGLHCFHYTRLSKRRSLILTKAMDSPPIRPRDDTTLVEIDYQDRSATKEKLGRLDVLVVGLSKIYGEARFLRGALRALRKEGVRPSVIHVHSANYLLTGAVLKRIYGAPLCLNFGGTELLRARSIPYYRWMFRQLDIGFYVARRMEESLFSMMDREKCVYTGNGVDHDLFFPDPDAEKRDEIICVGNLRWQKDYANLVEAFARIADRFPSYRVRIFGEGPERPALEQQIKAHGLEGRVVLEGMQSQETIRSAQQQARLFVICSKVEGFPKALIEAMACGLPVVATDAGECARVLEAISEVLPPGDSTALAKALETMIQDEGLRGQISAACRRRSQDFSWERVSEVVEATYDKLEGRER